MAAIEQYVTAVLLIFCALQVKAEKIMRPKMKEITVWSDEAYITHSVVYDGKDPHINLTMTVLQEILDVDLHFEGRLMRKTDPKYFFAFNTTMNFCGWIDFKNQSPIGTLLYAYLGDYGNLVRDCPIAKGRYFIHNFWIPEDSTTALLPEMDFELDYMAYRVDAAKKSHLLAKDRIVGEFVVQEVNNVKPGILAMLPKGR